MLYKKPAECERFAFVKKKFLHNHTVRTLDRLVLPLFLNGIQKPFSVVFLPSPVDRAYAKGFLSPLTIKIHSEKSVVSLVGDGMFGAGYYMLNKMCNNR